MIVGAGSGSGLTSRSLGATGGEEQHTLTINEMPKHGHNIRYSGSPDDSGANTASTLGYGINSLDMDFIPRTSGVAGDYMAFNGDGLGPWLAAAPEGGDQPHPNMPPFIVLLYCEKQ